MDLAPTNDKTIDTGKNKEKDSQQSRKTLPKPFSSAVFPLMELSGLEPLTPTMPW
jgi:hypothetical protein